MTGIVSFTDVFETHVGIHRSTFKATMDGSNPYQFAEQHITQKSLSASRVSQIVTLNWHNFLCCLLLLKQLEGYCQQLC